MNRIRVVAVITFVAFSLLASPLFAADFAPIFPKQGVPMVAPPNFTWAAGDYDYFVLYLRLPIPIPGYWYTPIPVPRYRKPYWRLPDALWDFLKMDGWCLWRVLAINTTTHAYEVTPWQYFQKVNDCVVTFPDPNVESGIRFSISKPAGEIMVSDLVRLSTFGSYGTPFSDLGGLEYCSGLKILHLSDIHIGYAVGLNDLEAVLRSEPAYIRRMWDAVT